MGPPMVMEAIRVGNLSPAAHVDHAQLLANVETFTVEVGRQEARGGLKARDVTLDTRSLQKLLPPAPAFPKSKGAWSLYLRAVRIHRNDLLSKLFDRSHQMYLAAILWDYSGRKPFVYPPSGTKKAEELILSLRNDETREFIGDGVNLWPSQPVVGSLNVILLAMISRNRTRQAGEMLTNLAKNLDGSTFAQNVMAIARNPAKAATLPVDAIVQEVAKIAGSVASDADDAPLTVLQGAFGAETRQKDRDESYEQGDLRVELGFRVSPVAK